MPTIFKKLFGGSKKKPKAKLRVTVPPNAGPGSKLTVRAPNGDPVPCVVPQGKA